LQAEDEEGLYVFKGKKSDLHKVAEPGEKFGYMTEIRWVMKETILVSVIIPTYNRKDIVLDAIQSVINQTVKDFEIIVVDDGSSDGTKEYLTSLNLPIKIISKENGGVSSARNIGIKSSQGKYIAFLDSDDVWLPEKLKHQIAYVTTHPDIALVYTDEYIEVNGEVQSKTRFERANLGDDQKNNFLLPGFVQHTPIHTSSVMVKKSVLDEVGYFNETLKIHEDSELWNRISQKYTFGFIDIPLATFRYTEGSEHLMKDLEKQPAIEEGKKYLKLYEEMHKGDMTEEIRGSLKKSYEVLASMIK
jgi:glycosyltransferase involved in cell wall biosynthesis